MTELKIVSFNIRCCDDPNGNSIPERGPRLQRVIAPYAPDIIGFQEYTPEWEPLIREYYGRDYEIFNQYRSTSEELESAPLLWRRDKFLPVTTGYFWLSDTPEQESKGWDEKYDCYRMCQYAILKHRQTGEEFTVMNTHFGFGDQCQTDSARLLHSYRRKISHNPTFVLGDFNMRPDSAGYAVMTRHFTDVNAVTARDLRTTYHGYRPETVKLSHIDYCFAGEGVECVSYKIITELSDGGFPSDHYGLYVQLRV